MNVFIANTSTNVTHSFGIDKHHKDALTGTSPLGRGWCYPGSDWFSLTLGGRQDDVHLTWAEWDDLAHHVDALRNQSKLVVKLVQKEAAQ